MITADHVVAREQMLVLPKDLKPGDVILRTRHDPLGARMFPVAVKQVLRVKGTSGPNLRYKIYMREQDGLTGYAKSMPENRHLVPFVVPARQRVLAVAAYDVLGDHGDGWEVETAETTRSEAHARLREYREHAPQGTYRVRKVVENVDE